MSCSENVVQEDMMGGCVLCEEKNFQREGFSDLTVILCDGCEREYHIKCLRERKAIDLDGLPEGKIITLLHQDSCVVAKLS